MKERSFNNFIWLALKYLGSGLAIASGTLMLMVNDIAEPFFLNFFKSYGIMIVIFIIGIVLFKLGKSQVREYTFNNSLLSGSRIYN